MTVKRQIFPIGYLCEAHFIKVIDAFMNTMIRVLSKSASKLSVTYLIIILVGWNQV